MLKKISPILFYAVSVFIVMWLSFFVEPVYSKYRNCMLYSLFSLLIFSFLSDPKRAKAVLDDKADIFLWLYFLVMTFGLLFAGKANAAINKYFIYALPIPVVYYFFKMHSFSMKDRLVIARVICAALVIVSIIGILEAVFHKNIIYERFVHNVYYNLYIANERVMSTQHAPQPLGTFIIACIPFALFLIEKRENIFNVILGILGMGFSIVTLMLTLSRGPVLALVVLLVVYFYKKCKRMIIPLLVLIVILMFIFSIYGADSAIWRLGLIGWTAQSDYSHRLNRVDTVLKILKDHPFMGLGLENYRYFFGKYFYIKYVRWDWRVTDNMYLLILAESGILGFLAFATFIFLLLRKALRCYNEFGFILLIALIGILGNMITYDLLYWTVPFYIFWIYCGMLSSVSMEAAQKT